MVWFFDFGWLWLGSNFSVSNKNKQATANGKLANANDKNAFLLRRKEKLENMGEFFKKGGNFSVAVRRQMGFFAFANRILGKKSWHENQKTQKSKQNTFYENVNVLGARFG